MQRKNVLTLSNATKSAAWRMVKLEISSTMRFNVGSVFTTIGGGGAEKEGGDVSAAGVVRVRIRGL